MTNPVFIAKNALIFKKPAPAALPEMNAYTQQESVAPLFLFGRSLFKILFACSYRFCGMVYSHIPELKRKIRCIMEFTPSGF